MSPLILESFLLELPFGFLYILWEAPSEPFPSFLAGGACRTLGITESTLQREGRQGSRNHWVLPLKERLETAWSKASFWDDRFYLSAWEHSLLLTCGK